MIFKETWQQVLDGTKTQTRRLVKPGEELINGDVGEPIEIHSHNMVSIRVIRSSARFVTGKTYAVQPGRGKKAIGRIRITKIRRERLQEISAEDLIAEGFPPFPYEDGSAEDADLPWFVSVWNSLYRKAFDWGSNPEVWVLGIEVVKEE